MRDVRVAGLDTLDLVPVADQHVIVHKSPRTSESNNGGNALYTEILLLDILT